MKFLVLAALLATSASSARAAYSPGPDLVQSPVLLADYIRWTKNSTALSENPEASLYGELIKLLYDYELGRGNDKAYFSELQSRFIALRTLLCPLAITPRLCSLSDKVYDKIGIAKLRILLQDPSTISVLEQRWGITIAAVNFPGRKHEFNFLSGSLDQTTNATLSYWNFEPKTIAWQWITPVISDIDTYQLGFSGEAAYTSQFALSKNGILINDWQLRDTAMAMAQYWKFNIFMNREMNPKDAVVHAEKIQMQTLFEENNALFESYYAELLPKTEASAETHKRFLEEKARGDFPEEVYQRVAYNLVSDIIQIQSAYQELAKSQRKQTSERQKALELLLTLQKHTSSWRMFLLELSTLSNPVNGHAVILGVAIDSTLARTFAMDLLRAILGMEVYKGADLYPRFAYTLQSDELFHPYYLKEFRPDLYKRFVQADGTLKKIASFSPAEQIQIFQSYTKNAIGVSRLLAAFANQVREPDLRELADIVHKAREKNFQ